MAYAVTGLFVVATLIVGAELLYSAQIAVATGDQGLLDLSTVLDDRYGSGAGTVFLVGFWSAAMSSLRRGLERRQPDVRRLRRTRARPGPRAPRPPHRRALVHGPTSCGSRCRRSSCSSSGKPIWLILAYGVLGAFFMPFLAVTLLWLLNSDRVPREWRNSLWSNVWMGITALTFVVLAATELQKQLAKL